MSPLHYFALFLRHLIIVLQKKCFPHRFQIFRFVVVVSFSNAKNATSITYHSKFLHFLDLVTFSTWLILVFWQISKLSLPFSKASQNGVTFSILSFSALLILVLAQIDPCHLLQRMQRIHSRHSPHYYFLHFPPLIFSMEAIAYL